MTRRARYPSPRPPSDETLGMVQAAFQPLSPQPFTRDDAREAVHNLGRFFAVLERWSSEGRADDGRTDPGRLRDTQPAEPGDPR